MARVFIVAGDSELQSRWERCLASAGHACTPFPNGIPLWRAIVADPPDVVIVPLFMRGKDGLELLRDLRSAKLRVATVILAADGARPGETLSTTALLLGAVAVLSGSPTEEEILSSVDAALTGSVPALEAAAGPRALPTSFASAERASPSVLAAQAQALASNELLQAVLSSLQNMVMVVNQDRQIVFINEHALVVAGLTDAEVRGLRPGEMIGCAHSNETPGGCGTTESCRSCGVVGAILGALRGEHEVQEARLVLESGNALDLRVSARPLAVGGDGMVVVCMDDISAEKRRRALERVFFHDVLNTAGGIQGLATLVDGSDGAERTELMDLLSRTASQLVREINSQRLLTAAENGEHPRERWPCIVEEALHDAVAANLALADERKVEIRVDSDLGDTVIMSDPALLGRVLANLTRNAVEASGEGDVVRLAARNLTEALLLTVQNPAAIPREVELQMFKRSFSTKGAGRGLGTYSARLFTERYLGGSVSLRTSPESGTTFQVALPPCGPAAVEGA